MTSANHARGIRGILKGLSYLEYNNHRRQINKGKLKAGVESRKERTSLGQNPAEAADHYCVWAIGFIYGRIEAYLFQRLATYMVAAAI